MIQSPYTFYTRTGTIEIDIQFIVSMTGNSARKAVVTRDTTRNLVTGEQTLLYRTAEYQMTSKADIPTGRSMHALDEVTARKTMFRWMMED